MSGEIKTSFNNPYFLRTSDQQELKTYLESCRKVLGPIKESTRTN